MMKRTILLAALFGFALPATAQEDTTGIVVPLQAGRIYRTEVIPYDVRKDADARNRAGAEAYLELALKPFATDGKTLDAGAVIDIPYEWTDGNTYLHLENIGAAYDLTVNKQPVASVEDPATPAEFAITPYIRQGQNAIIVTLRPGAATRIDGTPAVAKPYVGCYLYNQNKRSVRDFEVVLRPDSTQKFGVLDLKIILQNSFNYEESVTVGYDIYSPQGKLLEMNIVERLLPGRAIDTVRFDPYIYHTYENKWEAGGKTLPPLYRMMIFTRRNGAYKEYMPLKVGFGKTELVDGKLMRLGKELKLVKAVYNAAANAKTTRAQLLALKTQGKNTITPDYPQPAWFYELCDELGLYVIDRANINAPEKRDDRSVGGTPSNDPALAKEYLERVKAMYYRSRNFTCVIAFALGGPSGNGYNMYKAYEWLKGIEQSRPVVYEDADGEWNSDL